MKNKWFLPLLQDNQHVVQVLLIFHLILIIDIGRMILEQIKTIRK
jgi:hypothetical protein